MDLAQAEVRLGARPDFLGGFVQGKEIGGVVLVLDEVEVTGNEGVDVVRKGEDGGQLFPLPGQMVAGAGGEVEIDDLEWEELEGRVELWLQVNNLDAASNDIGVTDVVVVVVGFADGDDGACAGVGVVVVVDMVVGERALEVGGIVCI